MTFPTRSHCPDQQENELGQEIYRQVPGYDLQHFIEPIDNACILREVTSSV